MCGRMICLQQYTFVMNTSINTWKNVHGASAKPMTTYTIL